MSTGVSSEPIIYKYLQTPECFREAGADLVTNHVVYPLVYSVPLDFV
jgi:hypothetical protein